MLAFQWCGKGMCTDRGHELYISVRNIAKGFLCLNVFSRYFPAILITYLISAFWKGFSIFNYDQQKVNFLQKLHHIFFHTIIIGIKSC